MNTNSERMTKYVKSLGYWSSFILLATFIIYIICFIGILITNPLFTWTNLDAYIEYTKSYNSFLAELAKLFMIITGLSFMILAGAFHECASAEKKVFSRISLGFAGAFMISISIHYFVQLSGVRLSIEDGNTTGLEHFVQANPHSIMSSINMLGWTVFLGMSSLFLVPVFSNNYRLLQIAFLMNGINALLGAVAFVFDIIGLLAFTAYIGLGGFIMLISIASMRFFRKIEMD